MPTVKYLFASPDGDAVEAGEKDLYRPLHQSLRGTHRSLTLRDYFFSIKRFLLEENPDRFIAALSETVDNPSIHINSIDRIDVCSEKLGAFYHIAGVVVHCGAVSTKFAVSTAFTPTGRTCLEHDFNTVSKLHEQTGKEYLPRPFFMGTAGSGESSHEFLMVLWQWLEGFHEWHFSRDRETGHNRIVLWDTDHGIHFLPQGEEKEVFRQITKILTLCFDPASADQVCQWHNAAGDFIIKHGKDGLNTKLTTVREYHPVLDYKPCSNEDINLHLLFFFLDITVRINLDRLDGVDRPVWADRTFLPPVIQGFIEALHIMEKQQRISREKTDEFIMLLKSMTLQELRDVFEPLREIYDRENPLDSELIASNLEDHVKNLYKTIQKI